MDKRRNIRFGKIAILAGGPSSEREISLRSGTAVYGALTGSGLDTVFVDVNKDIYDIIKRHEMDVAFIALHGSFGEDGTVQKALEDAGIPYTGSKPDASRRALDKIEAKSIFVKKSIPTPRYAVAEKGKTEDAASFGFPLVVKPRFEGSSIGLSIVREEAALKRALDTAFRYGDEALLEEFIEGREITVGILEERALPVVEIITRNKVYDYAAKYADPETKYIVPATLERNLYERAQELGLKAHKALGCRMFSRVDMMLGKNGDIFVLEVNTIPGMTERSLLPKAAAAAGLGFSQLCIKLIENALIR